MLSFGNILHRHTPEAKSCIRLQEQLQKKIINAHYAVAFNQTCTYVCTYGMYVIVLIIKTDMSIIPLSVCYSFHVRSPGCLHSGAVWTERDLSAVRVRSGRTLLSAETQHTGYVRGAVYVAMCHMCAP